MAQFYNTHPHKDTSFPEMSYPSLRDDGLKTALQWIEGKHMDDGAEELWRIHDKLYDFSDFMKRHPGGEWWLKVTKGTDITEPFETHHLSTFPESLLEKFYIKDATTKRYSPFTFKDDGFYRSLKKRVREDIKTIPMNSSWKSKRIMEGIALGMFAFSIAACCVESTLTKCLLCILAGIFMGWTPIAAHNFIHQKDNFWMYFLNFSFYVTRYWRVTHALSHHMFPNTLLDYEINITEPFFLYLPRKTKSWLSRYAPTVYSFILYTFVFDLNFLRLVAQAIVTRKWIFMLEDLVGFTLPLSMFIFGTVSNLEILWTWIFVTHLGSLIYNHVGITAAHHHPDIFHDGDAPIKDRDWGLHQLHAVMDRVDINGSHFKVMTNFGEHGLHHMFPTMDHVYLPYLHKAFNETCEKFQTKLRETTQLALILGNYKQLARTECKMA